LNTVNEEKWRKYKEELKTTSGNLKEFVKSHSLEIMVPMGKKAFVRGKLLHTNEITVSHGSSIFSDVSSTQAVDLLEHRMKLCDTQLLAIEKERELFT
jgi:unconventional prefoldin RPB5 interactor 1